MDFLPRVLIVEDLDYHLENFQEVVARLGYTSVAATDLAQADESLQRYLFDAALVDLRLDDDDPDNWDGMKVLYRIRDIGEGTRVIVLTAHGEVEHAAEAFSTFGAYYFIGKHRLELPTLKLKISSAVRESHLTVVSTDVKKLLPGVSWPRVRKYLDLEHDVDSQAFLAGALEELQPLFPDRSPVRLLHDEHIIEFRAWSKRLGAAVLAHVFNSRFFVLDSRSSNLSFKAASIEKDDVQLSRILLQKYGPQSKLACMVYQLDGIAFEAFLAPRYPTLPARVPVTGFS